MTGGSVNKEAGILSRANELEKLAKQQQELEQNKMTVLSDLQEAQRHGQKTTSPSSVSIMPLCRGIPNFDTKGERK